MNEETVGAENVAILCPSPQSKVNTEEHNDGGEFSKEAEVSPASVTEQHDLQAEQKVSDSTTNAKDGGDAINTELDVNHGDDRQLSEQIQDHQIEVESNDPPSTDSPSQNSKSIPTTNENTIENPADTEDLIDKALKEEAMGISSEESDKDTDTSKPRSVATLSSLDAESGSASDAVMNMGNNRSDNASLKSDSDDSDSSSDSDSDSDSDVEMKGTNQRVAASDDESEDDQKEPLKSKNEVDAPVPDLPEGFQLNEKTPIEPIGILSQVVEKSAVIQASVSGEYRVLDEGKSVFCFEDRRVLGVLYETFGRVQAPCYSVKFRNEEEFESVKTRKGEKVFYVVPSSKFIYTETVRSVKGSDASNIHDEEIPLEEQEFSDDEMEMVAKQSKKKKKRKPNRPTEHVEGQVNRRPRYGNSGDRHAERHDWDNPSGSSNRPPPSAHHQRPPTQHQRPVHHQHQMPQQPVMPSWNPYAQMPWPFPGGMPMQMPMPMPQFPQPLNFQPHAAPPQHNYQQASYPPPPPPPSNRQSDQNSYNSDNLNYED